MRWRLPALAGALYVLALLAMAPATLLDAALGDASDGRLRIAEARGTLWRGHGQLEIRDAASGSGLAKRLSWRFRPAALLAAQLAWEVELGPQPRAFPLTLSPSLSLSPFRFRSRLEIARLELSLPAALLHLALPGLGALGLSGELQIQLDRLSLDREATRGNATVHWRGAGSALSELSALSPLGDYVLRLDSDGATVSARLHTLQGPLTLDGTGAWASAGPPQFVATARAPPALQERLAPFLRLIAVERGDGSFALQLR